MRWRRGDLRAHRQDWEELAELDPHWAIAGVGARKFGGWDEEEFFRGGQRAVDKLMARCHSLGRPARHGSALDFGCGIGRLSRALAAHFDEVVGLDISEGMVSQARALNAACGNLTFVMNPGPDLRAFPDARFDLVYAKLVLGHLPGEELVRGYVAEFARVMRPGGLAVFQMPTYIAPRHRIQHHRHLYRALRALGLRPATLYTRLGLQPLRLRSMPEARMLGFLESLPVRALARDTNDKKPVRSTTYYVTTA